MKYYRHLYWSEDLEKKKDKILKKLENGKLQLGTFLVVLPKSNKNQLEIIDCKLLFQPSYPSEELFVVAILSSYDEALIYIEYLLKEVYEDTKGTDIRNYILKKEQEE